MPAAILVPVRWLTSWTRMWDSVPAGAVTWCAHNSTDGDDGPDSSL
ncbi:MAG: hypothetical protein ACRDTA_19940 [Pseudonocardiaceae bacterium]